MEEHVCSARSQQGSLPSAASPPPPFHKSFSSPKQACGEDGTPWELGCRRKAEVRGLGRGVKGGTGAAGLGWGGGCPQRYGGPGTCSVCLLRHTQILLEAEGLKKVSQAPFLSEGPHHVPWLDETWIYFFKFLRNNNKKGKDSGL